MSFTHYQMPMYTQDHETYWKQMYDWHMKMHHYKEQLRAYHLDQAKHFQKLMGEKIKTSEFK
ncbi:hypothetical protein M5X11_05600 [Paenibacillus alginolyticus]|uniref:hypothetical protein n=1 Tax=Paenibacillus alginolyticus TaxID=59839 RepID=UPI00040CC7E5|nr:hypothetical protein [Paenibacillus alginolyticus]MCY9664433.1 hypothetical protein [Paenibacillus alginolyticus]